MAGAVGVMRITVCAGSRQRGVAGEFELGQFELGEVELAERAAWQPVSEGFFTAGGGEVDQVADSYR
jgi:hypothetical protein